MKKALLSILLTLLPILASAETVEIGGVYYILEDENKTAKVTSMPLGYYSDDIIIPEEVTCKGIKYKVTSIGRYAFSDCDGLTSIDIPNSVTSIGENAFNNCSGLTSVTIPNSVTSIGEEAFLRCSGLASVTIPNSVTSIALYAFYECSSLTSVTIPNSVTSIGDCAFWGCSSLTSVAIPNSLTSIGISAFLGCSSLTSITIPNSLTSIGVDAFYGCCGLTSIKVEDDNPQYDSRNSCNGIIETSSNTLIVGCMNTIIPNDVTSIDSYVFSGCNGLTSVTIPNSVTSIGENAFHGCSGLTCINIPNSVTSIGSSAFSRCSGLTSIKVEDDNPQYDSRNSCNGIIETSLNTLIVGCKNTIIPNDVTSIGEYAFGGCSGLTSVTIPNSVTSIERLAFGGCTGLTFINIPNSVTSIGSSAFSECGLSSIIIPPKVSSIDNYTFWDCTELKSVTLPNNVTSIGKYAFEGCINLKDFYSWTENVPASHSYAFSGIPFEFATLHVPAVSVDAYKKTFPWSQFWKIVALADDDPSPTSVNSLKVENNISPKATFSLDGCRLSNPQRGLNIIRMSDGTTKKVIKRL